MAVVLESEVVAVDKSWKASVGKKKEKERKVQWV